MRYNSSRQSNYKRLSLSVYDIQELDKLYPLTFNSISEAAKILHIHRATISKYLDSNFVYNGKYVFSTTLLDKEFLSRFIIPKKVWEVITGELLGDGHLRYDPINKPNINGRLEFTFSADIRHYVDYLKFDVLSPICTKSPPTGWPNIVQSKESKKVTQYWFSSKRMSLISDLHRLWYKSVDGKYVKVLPKNLENMLTPRAIAHWIMGDGYFSGSVLICTDNFTKDEVSQLIDTLDRKFFLKAYLRERKLKDRSVWRIYISKSSLDDLKKLILPFFIPEMLYKLGIKNK